MAFGSQFGFAYLCDPLESRLVVGGACEAFHGHLEARDSDSGARSARVLLGAAREDHGVAPARGPGPVRLHLLGLGEVRRPRQRGERRREESRGAALRGLLREGSRAERLVERRGEPKGRRRREGSPRGRLVPLEGGGRGRRRGRRRERRGGRREAREGLLELNETAREERGGAGGRDRGGGGGQARGRGCEACEVV